ncbi:MAG TPA: ribose 5-phosphate isomerase B [Chitinophagaceae bacterium]|nr:ribose 5-phosphate isomerase B [Chitinophagaceae bacterium]HNF71213.1 ribose 5-phosphate isomerase B [Chitinophagaceae bacterium]
MKIAIGADHAGVDLKAFLVQTLQKEGHDMLDQGTFTHDSVDYPDFAHPVASLVESGEAFRGILICGSANGVCITANKHAGIRAALCWKKEIAELARLHNDANIIGLPARFLNEEEALDCVHAFLNTSFEGGRHEARVKKIAC